MCSSGIIFERWTRVFPALSYAAGLISLFRWPQRLSDFSSVTPAPTSLFPALAIRVLGQLSTLGSHLLWARARVRGPLEASLLVFSFSAQPLGMSELGRVSESGSPVLVHLSKTEGSLVEGLALVPSPAPAPHLHPEQVPPEGGAEVTAPQTGHPPCLQSHPAHTALFQPILPKCTSFLCLKHNSQPLSPVQGLQG